MYLRKDQWQKFVFITRKHLITMNKSFYLFGEKKLNKPLTEFDLNMLATYYNNNYGWDDDNECSCCCRDWRFCRYNME